MGKRGRPKLPQLPSLVEISVTRSGRSFNARPPPMPLDFPTLEESLLVVGHSTTRLSNPTVLQQSVHISEAAVDVSLLFNPSSGHSSAPGTSNAFVVPSPSRSPMEKYVSIMPIVFAPARDKCDVTGSTFDDSSTVVAEIELAETSMHFSPTQEMILSEPSHASLRATGPATVADLDKIHAATNCIPLPANGLVVTDSALNHSDDNGIRSTVPTHDTEVYGNCSPKSASIENELEPRQISN